MVSVAQANISRRTFLKAMTAGAIATPLAGVGGYVYSTDIEPTNLDINPVSLTLPRLDPQFNGLKIAQLSDFHMGSWMNRERLVEIIQATNQQQPDVVALTGDYFTGVSRRRRSEDESFNTTRNNDYAEDLETALSLIEAPTVVGVLGNHDHRGWASLTRQLFANLNIVDLSNTVHTLESDGASFHIAGVDDVKMGHDRLSSVLSQLPADGAAILLAHEPDFADASAPTGRFDLQISGHSHGGQVILPLVGPIVLPELGRKYPVGLYNVEGMYQYTNRGVGMSEPAVRFNCRPELTIFTLQSPHTTDNHA